jgi:hypothetical protein
LVSCADEVSGKATATPNSSDHFRKFVRMSFPRQIPFGIPF